MKACVYCGAQYEDGTASCPKDGHPLVEAAPAAGTLEAADIAKYRGYGGWLAFFALSNLALAPVFALFNVVQTFMAIGELWAVYPRLVVTLGLETFLRILLTAFGCVVGWRLRKLRPGAARAAKVLLVAMLGFTALDFCLTFFLANELPKSVSEPMLKGSLRSLARSVFSTAIWYGYFAVSKRVKANFPGE